MACCKLEVLTAATRSGAGDDMPDDSVRVYRRLSDAGSQLARHRLPKWKNWLLDNRDSHREIAAIP